MKKFLSNCVNFVLFIIFASIFVYSFFIKCNITLNFEGISKTFSLLDLMLFILYVYVVKLLFVTIANFLKKLFSFKRKNCQVNLIDAIQSVLSSILLKDSVSAKKALEKLKKQFGESSLSSWFEGNISVLENDIHRAKSLFYKATSSEKETCLGSYSLCSLARKYNDYSTEMDALKSMLNTSNGSDKSMILLRLISIKILNKKYEDIETYTKELKFQKYRKWKRIAAIYNFCLASDEMNCHDRLSLLENAFEYAPEITDIAIAYSDELLEHSSPSKARKVLLESWKLCPSKSIFDRYIYINKETDLDNVFDNADKLIATNNTSWIGYFNLGKLLFENEKYEDAFYNLLTAYGKIHSKEVVNVLIECANKLHDPKPISAREILDGNVLCEDFHFAFVCDTCGCISHKWIPICDKCQSIDSYRYKESNRQDAPTEIIDLRF